MQPLSPPARIRLALSATSYNLPIFMALDKGYFDKAGLQVDVTKAQGSTNTLYPALAKGDLDVFPGIPSPALFNQATQGFDVKIIGAIGQERAGRAAGVSLMVIKSKADQIKDFKDLAGKNVDGATQGSPLGLAATVAIADGGLSAGKDVQLVYHASTPPDMLAVAKSGASDVIAMIEPTATQTVAQGLTVRWKTLADIAPWYQPTFLAASRQFLQQNPAAAAKFMEVMLLTEREIDASNGQWTDDLTNSTVKWTGTPADVVKSEGGVIYYDPNGAVSLESLQKTQDVLAQQGLVKQTVEPQQLIDSTALNSALQAAGKA
ncbi:MAG: ABC transporter substrate-binding protein [Chloroflexi bacterium]|nr:ABC transporter substrate-binding protein [Chloroflexota bacterium]